MFLNVYVINSRNLDTKIIMMMMSIQGYSNTYLMLVNHSNRRDRCIVVIALQMIIHTN